MELYWVFVESFFEEGFKPKMQQFILNVEKNAPPAWIFLLDA